MWAVVALLALISFLPVYSASGNLENVVQNGTAIGHLAKHAFLLGMGFVIMFGIHKIPTHFFKGLSLIGMPIVLLLLVYTLAQGSTIGGANASRWIKIPFTSIGFQTSTLAMVVLMVYIARYLSKIKDQSIRFTESILPLWLPVFSVVALVFPANFSTAAILFSMVMMLCFIGGYPIKYLLGIAATGLVMGALFVMTAKAFPGLFPNRVDTWMSRIENFSSDEITEADYQVERAKIAIATGGVFGLGAGKSVMKNFLPQSSSDFIFAIIIEEYGMVGGFIILGLYLFLLIRIIVIANGAPTFFAKLIALGVGLPIVFQAFINMGVAVSLLPVTGQTLPLISSGGTSIWMTCLALGILLSASNKSAQTAPATVTEETTNPLEILSEQL
ncbi:MAG: FtsW/RodA/SpoVE family cell cycle protein [Flavobacteriaceae bacterium]|nr:FtsW/RodA/SpoVE family cell cycle protein [Flavobacteriaceae bacterium]MCO4854327.1 FtsW/RodA/SpoVE family cell cycle protein [Flavobacteriaceae bacterium]MDA9252479.1 FtsW/RodA/SpoVE family cell cycle protein [Flavobacteriaceae bacterium]MDA9364009.1 FtsW/RodA/SpoVE family cell cycle protein [Flavobacteriaceae bacterium]MDA9374305.1 FtsW/RodA/SpoVE family cell cycle protein [Flavobacteriaceae bacterium]